MAGIDRQGAPARDTKISQCKICGYGVFRRQEHRWQTGHSPGLVHARREDCGV